MKYIAFIFIFVALFLCSCNNIKVNDTLSSDVQSEDTLRTITKETAFEGVNNYCHREYDWSVAKDNPDQVIFRSYTGAFVHFYVNKTNGATRMVERVPNLNVEEDAGTINLFDYLKKQK